MLREMLLRRPRVTELTGLPRSTMYQQIKDGKFPAPVKLGARAVGWRESDIASWIESRTVQRGA